MPPLRYTLSVDQTQAMLPFALVLPAAVPSTLKAEGVGVQPVPVGVPLSGTPGGGQRTPMAASLRYVAVRNSAEMITIDETNELTQTPSAVLMQETLNKSVHKSAKTLPRPSQTTIEIQQQPILKTVIYMASGEPILTYTWDHNGVHIDVTGIIGPYISSALVEHLVASMVAR